MLAFSRYARIDKQRRSSGVAGDEDVGLAREQKRRNEWQQVSQSGCLDSCSLGSPCPSWCPVAKTSATGSSWRSPVTSRGHQRSFWAVSSGGNPTDPRRGEVTVCLTLLSAARSNSWYADVLLVPSRSKPVNSKRTSSFLRS